VAEASSAAAEAVDRFAKRAGIGSVLDYGLGAAALLPVAAGGVAGYSLAKAKNEDVDVDDVKREELIREYQRLGREARDSVRSRITRRSGA